MSEGWRDAANYPVPMSPRSSVLVTVCIGVASLSIVGRVGAQGPEPPDECFALGENGVPVTCTNVDGEWVVTETEGLGPGLSDDDAGGLPGGFVAVGVLAVVGAVGFAVWRIVLARNMARRAGMDENEATAMTFLSDSGLAATYVASSLRPEPPTQSTPQASTPPASAPPSRTASQRMGELMELKEQGRVTDEEYESRRKAILDSL